MIQTLISDFAIGLININYLTFFLEEPLRFFKPKRIK